MVFPVWCHHHCTKFGVERAGKKRVVLTASAAKVTITRVGKSIDQGWYVDWEVRHSADTKVNGRAYMQMDMLRAAFGLANHLTGDSGDWLIERYGADSAQQHAYIRWKNYLNIPCPGTGHDGDPNVSIELDDDIKDAVRKLLLW